MDRAQAIDELPVAYAVATRLRDSGADEAQIAAALGVELDAVGPLLKLADAKLVGLLALPAAHRPARHVPDSDVIIL